MFFWLFSMVLSPDCTKKKSEPSTMSLLERMFQYDTSRKIIKIP